MSASAGRSLNCLLPSAYCLLLSKCRAGRLVRGVGARVEDAAHLADDQLQLLVPGVEVGRDAYAGAGAVVDDDFAADQLARDGGRVVGGDRDGAAAPRGVARARHAQAGLLAQLDEPLRLPDALLANSFDAYLV